MSRKDIAECEQAEVDLTKHLDHLKVLVQTHPG